jgi:hypothetical protein
MDYSSKCFVAFTNEKQSRFLLRNDSTTLLPRWQNGSAEFWTDHESRTRRDVRARERCREPVDFQYGCNCTARQKSMSRSIFSMDVTVQKVVGSKNR